MELDIQNISNNTVRSEMARRKADADKASKARAEQASSSRKRRAVLEQDQQEKTVRLSEKDAEAYLKDILRMSSLFDRKLKFVLNRDLGTVVVKVVDRETDKVIKEIPPEALQRLHRRMKEAIGLLIDEEI
jgi:flagellar protein FlaG